MRLVDAPGPYGTFSAGYPALLERSYDVAMRKARRRGEQAEPRPYGSAKAAVVAAISAFGDTAFSIRQVAEDSGVSYPRVTDIVAELTATGALRRLHVRTVSGARLWVRDRR